MAKKAKKNKGATTRKFSKRKLMSKNSRRVKVAKGPKQVKKHRPAYKSVALPDLALDVVLMDAFAEIESLREEMEEITSNMSGMEHLPKYETAEEAERTLQEHCDCPEVPEALKDLVITGRTELVSTRKGRASGRSTRLSNAMDDIEKVCDFLDTHAEVVEPGEDQLLATDELREQAREFASELSEHHGFDVEFPGMYG